MLPCSYVTDILNYDAEKIICSSAEGRVFLVDIEKNMLVHTMESDESVVFPSEHLCMPTPNLVTYASENLNIELWDIRRAVKIGTLQGHS